MSDDNGIANLDRRAIEARNLQEKQLAATVRLKRMGAVDAHFNAALQYLYQPRDNQPRFDELDDAGKAAKSKADEACFTFVESYFKNATKNIVDLTSELAKESFELLAMHEAAKTNQASG